MLHLGIDSPGGLGTGARCCRQPDQMSFFWFDETCDRRDRRQRNDLSATIA